MLKAYLKKSIITILLFICVVAISSCSAYMDDYIMRNVTNYAQNVIEELNNDFYLGIKKNSKSIADYPELTDEQNILFEMALDSINIKFNSAKVNSNRKKANCEVEISYIDFSEIARENPNGTFEFYKEQIAKASTSTSTIKLTILLNSREYIFQDLTILSDIIEAGFRDIEFLDENGMPLDLDYEFIESMYVGSCWLESFRSNPLTELCTDFIGGNNSSCMENPDTLRVEFYFNAPISVDLTVDLCKDDEVIASYDVYLDKEIILMADFSKYDIGGEDFTPGNYQIGINYNGYRLIASESIRVE